jgi:ubiquinone/menaquinone biosynthesis C-methylase UbiE
MKFFKTTQQHSQYWKDRKINWLEHYAVTWNHPHRQFIIDKLKTFKWISVIEIGCACGPNLMNIVSKFPRADVGGIDISEDAIKTARDIFADLYKGTLRSAWFKVGSGENVMISDSATDVCLTDMALIYVSRKDIKKYLLEMKRISRNRVMMLEFHHTNPFKRFWLKWTSGYNAHNYKKLLEECGFGGIEIEKLPPELWDNHEPQKTFAYLITAKV